MYRRKYYESNGEALMKFLITIIFIAGLILYFYFKTHPEALIKSLIVVSVILILTISLIIYIKKSRSKHRNEILMSLGSQSNNFNILKTFIKSFGKQKDKNAWKYRDYSFKDENLVDIRNHLIKNGVPLKSRNLEDICFSIEYVIDEYEREYLQNVVESKGIRKFSQLGKNGKDFENLISRLSDAMGYSSRVIGASGDQGGDVIAAKDGERVLIQAKFYTGSVGNAAVQQAVAAMKYHNCNRSMVVTNSYFTSEAKSLAQSNNVNLVDGDELKKLLVENLNEAWVD